MRRRSLIAAAFAAFALAGCSTVGGFIDDNPHIIDAGTFVACGQAACRVEGDAARAELAAQLNQCGRIIEAGCREGFTGEVEKSAAGEPAVVIEIPAAGE